ncbi:hypothetical protein P8452_32882 [Trifolium repens]|nr:hypothetical protein P8452_32882 [Trifolium repens]
MQLPSVHRFTNPANTKINEAEHMTASKAATSLMQHKMLLLGVVTWHQVFVNPFYEALGLYDLGSSQAVQQFCSQSITLTTKNHLFLL